MLMVAEPKNGKKWQARKNKIPYHLFSRIMKPQRSLTTLLFFDVYT